MTIVEALKELAVKINSVDPSTITSDEISEVIKYIADNWEAGAGYTLPESTTEKIGGVKQTVKVNAVASENATAAVGENPTKAEFDKVVNLANELKTQLNDLITKEQTSKQMSS